MRTTPKSSRVRMLAISVAAVIGFAACGSDEDTSSDSTATTAEASDDSAVDVSNPDVSSPDVSVPGVTIPDVSLPEGVTIPPVAGLGEECQAYYQLFASAFAGDSAAVAGLDDAVEDLQAQVPDELEDDVEVVAEAITELVELSKKYEGNPSGLYADPDALALFGDPAFAESQQNVTNWLQSECGTAG